MGVSLFVHAVRLVFSDLRNVLRLSGALYIGLAVLTIFISLFVRVQPESPGWYAINLIMAVLYFIAFAIIAVAWHRYILLNEQPDGLVPSFDRSRLLAYIGYSLLIGVILVVIAIIIGIITGILAALIGYIGVGIGLLGYVFMLIGSYRLSPMLPAAAVGKSMTLRQAWDATAGANGPIIVLAILSFIAAIVIDLPAVGLAYYGGAIGGFIAMLWTLVTGWIKFAVGVSIVTTLYGHYVEGRPLS
jgi:hypothetical protein